MMRILLCAHIIIGPSDASRSSSSSSVLHYTVLRPSSMVRYTTVEVFHVELMSAALPEGEIFSFLRSSWRSNASSSNLILS